MKANSQFFIVFRKTISIKNIFLNVRTSALGNYEIPKSTF